jgi:phage terminase large subunit-like protein
MGIRHAGRHGRHRFGCDRLEELETAMMDEGGPDRLRILVSDGQGHRLDEVLYALAPLETTEVEQP